MRLVMLGTGPFAVPTLENLAASEHEVALVVSRPPKTRDSTASPLQRAGELLGLEVWLPESVNTPEAQLRLALLNADLLVVCDYGEILKPMTLATTRIGGINLHGSLLPKYRGAAPVQRAILNGETETGNSVIQMTPGLDAGPCLGQQRTTIDSEEDAGQLETRLAALGADLVAEVISQLAAGTARPIEQDKGLASKAPRLKKEEGAIDWTRPARVIKNQVRALRPWPRAHTFWHRKDGAPVRLNIDCVAINSNDRGEAASTRLGSPQAAAGPGAILEASARLLVAASDAPLEIIELQPAGKRAMSAAEFLRGNRVAVGDRFGPE